MTTGLGRWRVLSMYLFCVLVWGTTYYAYRGQVGYAAADVSLLYRLGLAGCFFWVLSKYRGGNRILHVRDHLSLAGFGLCNFFLAYFFLYSATELIVSAFVVIIFSTKAVWTPVATRIFLKRSTHRARSTVWLGWRLWHCRYRVARRFSRNHLGSGNCPSFSRYACDLDGRCFLHAKTTPRASRPCRQTRGGWHTPYLVRGALSSYGGTRSYFQTQQYTWTSLIWLTVAASLIAWTFLLTLGGSRGRRENKHDGTFFSSGECRCVRAIRGTYNHATASCGRRAPCLLPIPWFCSPTAF